MDRRRGGAMTSFFRVATSLVLLFCLSAGAKPSYLISPGADRHIRFALDESD